MHKSRYDNIHGDEDGIELSDRNKLDATIELLEGSEFNDLIDEYLDTEAIRNLAVRAWFAVNTQNGVRRFVEDSRIITVALAAMVDEILERKTAESKINEKAAGYAQAGDDE